MPQATPTKTEQDLPSDPIAAVTHADPYPYYAELAARLPLHHNEALGLWVAASAEAVTAAVTSDCCAVRPPAEPVPKTLLNSAAAEIFGQLVRMTEGPRQRALKQAVAAALGSLDPAQAAAHSRRWACELAAEDPRRIAAFSFELPVYVVASLLGIPDEPEELLPAIFGGISDFVAALAPAANADQVFRGKAGAASLLTVFRSLLSARSPGTLLESLVHEAQSAGQNDVDAILANAIGFMSQAHDATAGLIGNTLVALARHPAARRRAAAEPGLLRQVILEVLRYDPPVQNTRRFVVREGVIAGRTLHPGDAVLVLLAAANRDPSANPHPDRFDVDRLDRRVFTFGAGLHACPGDALAITIAEAGIEQLLLAGIDLVALAAQVTYRPSINTRIPVFAVSNPSTLSSFR
jgi:cytochrome P450